MRGVPVRGLAVTPADAGVQLNRLDSGMTKRPLAGGSTAASHFLLDGQEKVTKENAALLRHPFGAGLD